MIRAAALLLVAVVAGAFAYVWLGHGEPPAAATTVTPVAPGRDTLNPARPATIPRYLFDVYGHTEAELVALLRRARDIHQNLPPGHRDALRIALVIHGPDVEYFALRNYDRYADIVDLAASLDADGFVDLKVCAVSARNVDAPGFPPFIELVPYGPDEIARLHEDGYIQL